MTDELSARAALIAASITGLALLVRHVARLWGQQNAQAAADLDVWRAVEQRIAEAVAARLGPQQGCVCPAGAELSCAGRDCPRRTALPDPAPWPFERGETT